MLKNLTLGIICLLFITGCHKKDKDSGAPPLPKISYSLDSSHAKPGAFLILTSDKNITIDSATIKIGNSTTLLAKIDSLHYGFIVPVLTPGNYNLDLTKVHSSTSPSLTILNYSVIANPNAVLTKFTSDMQTFADSLQKNNYNNLLSRNSIDFIRQVITQINLQFQQLSSNEKLLAAYQIQQTPYQNTPYHSLDIDTTYFAKIANIQGDPLSDLFSKANIARNANNAAKVAVGAALISCGAAVFTKNPLFIVGALGLFGVAAYLKGIALSNSNVASSVAGVATNLQISDGSGTANPIVFTSQSTFSQRFESIFRTLQTSDRTSPSTEIAGFITSSESLQTEDGKLKQLYDQAKAILSSAFINITATYEQYISPVLVQAKRKLAPVPNSSVIISGASNPDLIMSAFDDGANGVKLSVSNPSNNITTETSFTFQANYNQSALRNNVLLTEQAKYIPMKLPTVSTAIPGSVTASSALLGGTIIDDGGSAILDRGIIYSTSSSFTPSTSVSMGSGSGTFLQIVSGLNANASYFAKAYATSSSGTAYGNIVDFETTDQGIANKYWDITIGYAASPNVYDYALVIFKADSTLKYTEPAYPGLYDSNGVWSMSGSTITWSINLGNYRFSGTVQGDRMSGTFKGSSTTGTWTGSVH